MAIYLFLEYLILLPSMKDVVTLMLIQTFSSFIMTLITNLFGFLNGCLLNYEVFWCKLRGYIYYDVSHTSSPVEGIVPNNVIESITSYLKTITFKGNMIVQPPTTGADAIIIPTGWSYSEIDKVWFKYSVTRAKLADNSPYYSTTKRYELCGIGNDVINKFLDKCSVHWNASQKTIVIEKELNILQSFTIDTPVFMTHEFESACEFDKLFFPQKDLILFMIKKLEMGKIRRLTIVLSGTPGCGKTSIIKAIINHTRRVAYQINLKKVRNANQLHNLFFSQTPYTTAQVPNKKRLIYIEEIDTAGKLVAQREELPEEDLGENREENHEENITETSDETADKSKSPPAMFTHTSGLNDKATTTPTAPEKTKIFTDKNKVTLGDLLTTFDGVLELSGIITIITTNFPKKLDKALMRSGRVQLHCNLKPCLVSNALKIIQLHHPDYNVASYPLKDYGITPSDLEAYCEMSETEEELNKRMRGNWVQ